MRSSRRARGGGFALVEVILALTILGIAVSALMHSFTQSFQATRVMEIQTQAAMLAQQLMEEYEVRPPQEELIEAGFGPSYPTFWYQVRMEYVEPQYPRQGRQDREIEQYFAMRRLDITIHYRDLTDPRRDFIPLRVSTAIVGFEKYSADTKRSYTTQ